MIKEPLKLWYPELNSFQIGKLRRDLNEDKIHMLQELLTFEEVAADTKAYAATIQNMIDRLTPKQ